jgi:hypothetical protein
MASNNVTITINLGNFGDWIEIYNPTNTPIDLAGLYITDDLADPTKYQFPSGNNITIIPAYGFKLVWADDSANLLHTNFKLNGTNGETIILFSSDGISIIDSISFGTQNIDISFGRTIDGGNLWTTFTTPTPNASNDPTTLRNEINNTNHFYIYPNPTNNDFFVLGSTWDFMNILDIKGKLILTIQSNHFDRQSINVADLENGVYLIQLNNNHSAYSQRFIKQ